MRIMLFTERSRRLLQWINGHGFVTIEQAATWIGVCYFVGWRRASQLTKAGYLQQRRFERSAPRVRWLTCQRWKVSGDHLKAPKLINRVTYFHDTMLVGLSRKLAAETGSDFTTERSLRASLASKRRTKRHPG
ncbi:MAG: hypothetical protein AAF543_02755 [Pseudomonadota bacterium]